MSQTVLRAVTIGLDRRRPRRPGWADAARRRMSAALGLVLLLLGQACSGGAAPAAPEAAAEYRALWSEEGPRWRTS